MADEDPVTSNQCRAARALIGWSRADLATACGVAASTLSDFEGGKRVPYPRTLADIRRALEAAGVIFLCGDGTVGPGVRLRATSAESGSVSND